MKSYLKFLLRRKTRFLLTISAILLSLIMMLTISIFVSTMTNRVYSQMNYFSLNHVIVQLSSHNSNDSSAKLLDSWQDIKQYSFNDGGLESNYDGNYFRSKVDENFLQTGYVSNFDTLFSQRNSTIKRAILKRGRNFLPEETIFEYEYNIALVNTKYCLQILKTTSCLGSNIIDDYWANTTIVGIVDTIDDDFPIIFYPKDKCSSYVLLELSPDANYEVTILKINKYLGAHLVTRDTVIDTELQYYQELSVAINAITFILIFISSFSVANTISIMINERTNEIGVRKALGASNLNILVQFVFETDVMILVAYLLAFILSLGLNYCVTPILNLPISIRDIKVDFINITKIGLIILIVGTLIGIIPAVRASKIKIIDALRVD